MPKSRQVKKKQKLQRGLKDKDKPGIQTAETLWNTSRSGSHAGRGFHYQDAIAVELALEHLEAGTLGMLIPEGLEDISLDTANGPIHIQAKSRREHRGLFRLSELKGVWTSIAKRLIADPGSSAVLVLERGIEEITDLQVVKDTNLIQASLSEVAEVLLPSVRDDLGSLEIDENEFLSRLSVEVRDGLPSRSLQILSDLLGLPRASCEAHYSAVRDRISALADANGIRPITDPASLSRMELRRLLDDISEAVDPSALDEAVRGGICEIVDFHTKIEDPSFYSGIDVLPGHVTAGLVLPRTETERAAEALEEQGRVLITGPSGAGKSALAWLTSFESRHRITWYRIRKLGQTDVTPLVRFAKGCMPSGSNPIGFIADDVGTEGRDGWDHLVRELRSVPNVVLIGACREEDLFTLRTAVGTLQVRPQLDEVTAERIFVEVTERGLTHWGGWREPCEQSQGLLLEYVHILTEGSRLADTIRAQIDRRLLETRDIELEVLRLVSTCHRYGADISLEGIGNHLEVAQAEFQRAMVRLIDEHLIRATNDGRLTGLHELRSAAISRAIHRVPPADLQHTVVELVSLLEPVPLQIFLTRFLGEGNPPGDIADALASRFTTSPDPQAISAVLQALRVSGFAVTAESWAGILREEGVSSTHASLLAIFALQRMELPGLFSDEIQNAAERMREIPIGDCRPVLLEKLDSLTLERAVESANPDDAMGLLASLAHAQLFPSASTLASTARELDLKMLRVFLEAAFEITPELAIEIVELLGGPEDLLARLEEELPWVRNARLELDSEVVAAADYAAVAPSVQEDPHHSVVELCEYLLAIVPTAAIARSRAIDATGNLYGTGEFPVADKSIPRKNLTPDVSVAWNRAAGRALTRAVAAPSYTQRLEQELEIVEFAIEAIALAAETYLTGDSLPEAVAASGALAAAAQVLLAPPEGVEIASSLELGSGSLSDPVGFLATVIPNNLVPRLLKEGASVATLIPQLIKQVEVISDEKRWSLLPEPTVPMVTRLENDLRDLHVVLSEANTGDEAVLKLRQVASRTGKNKLSTTAAYARNRVHERVEAHRRAVRQILRHAGHTANVYTRPLEFDSPYWPPVETLIVINTLSLIHWLTNLESIIALVTPQFENVPPYILAPVREGLLVSSYAVTVIGDKQFPVTSGIGEWDHLDIPVFVERVTKVYRQCIDALLEVSGIVASLRKVVGITGQTFRVHQSEQEALDAAMQVAGVTLEKFTEMCSELSEDALPLEALAILVEFACRVEQEGDSRNQGGPQWGGLAADILTGMGGEPNYVFNAHRYIVTVLTEWELEPDGVQERLKVE